MSGSIKKCCSTQFSLTWPLFFNTEAKSVVYRVASLSGRDSKWERNGAKPMYWYKCNKLTDWCGFSITGILHLWEFLMNAKKKKEKKNQTLWNWCIAAAMNSSISRRNSWSIKGMTFPLILINVDHLKTVCCLFNTSADWQVASLFGITCRSDGNFVTVSTFGF